MKASRKQPEYAKRTVTIDMVICDVCRELSVEPEWLFGKSRHPMVVWARAIITTVAREATFLSFPEIARSIGSPNHSTVITAAHRVRDILTLPSGNPRRVVCRHSGRRAFPPPEGPDVETVLNAVRIRLNLPSAVLPTPGVAKRTEAA